MKINILYILFFLTIIVTSKKTKFTTEIKIITNDEEEEEIKQPKNEVKNGTKFESEEEEKEKKDEEEEEKEKEKEEPKEPIRDSIKVKKNIPENKYTVINAPYQDNEDYLILETGFGKPVNFIPLQIETTSYKSWVLSSLNNKGKRKSYLGYNKKESKTSEESNEWDTVVDQKGTISGNVIYDKLTLDKFEIDHYKFIEAIDFENFEDYQLGKLGLGNCHYADANNKEFCLLQRLRENGSIERRVFSLRELSDSNGELVIGDVTKNSKDKDYPLLKIVGQDTYNDIEDFEFKMSWITKISHVLIHDSDNNIKNIFNNNIKIEEGLASFDSSSHYIEAPYHYINYFQEKIFDKYLNNICRKVNYEGTYIFLCIKDKFDEIKEEINELSLVFVMDNNGFEIPLQSLFEQTKENDYEFFVHFKDFEQNIWNLGHPFFHLYTIIFDQDNQQIGIDGKNIYFLENETKADLGKSSLNSWWKIPLILLLGFCAIAVIFYFLRRSGIISRINKGVPPNLVDQESVDDLALNDKNKN